MYGQMDGRTDGTEFIGPLSALLGVQKSSATLSGFWPLRGWGVWVNPIKKENL